MDWFFYAVALPVALLFLASAVYALFWSSRHGQLKDFEKGAAYYFQSAPFLAKLALFAAVGLLSIVPTREFLSWRKALRRGEIPVVDPRRLKTIRSVIHWELVCLVPILVFTILLRKQLLRGITFGAVRK